eukprot:TRINITY_DN22994_c0_g2_i1.p1 TRINITY_DN22994_c0_g2~~TRINITY_DN22994_c0_g2_i1.p1  ORF type:complete len:168 (-),score=2.81 TRINITY_DN22994_c0_g2_i1:53-556(-)
MSIDAMVNRPTFVETKNQRFLIMDAPTDSNLSKYLELLKKRKVTHVVRACEPTYSTEPLIQAGIKVTEMPFKDGDPPPDDVVDKWLELVNQEFSKSKDTAVAVHCVAGLGRAPALVAVAMVEDGMEPHQAITFIRSRRRGAINAKQLKYLQSYKRRPSPQGCACQIM